MPKCDGDSDADGSDDEERKTQPLRGEMSPISDDDQDQLPAGLEVTLPGGQRFPVASLPPDLRKIVLAQLKRPERAPARLPPPARRQTGNVHESCALISGSCTLVWRIRSV